MDGCPPSSPAAGGFRMRPGGIPLVPVAFQALFYLPATFPALAVSAVPPSPPATGDRRYVHFQRYNVKLGA